MSVIDTLIDPNGKREWRKHWPVIVAAMGGFLVTQIPLFSLGVVISPLQKEFGWSRAQITSGLFIISMVLFPLSPLLGIVIDRIGARRIALCGCIVYPISIALLSLAQHPIWTWWLLWFFLAIGSSLLSGTVWIAAISRLFDASLGLALAVSLSAAGVTSVCAPLLTYFFVENFGWRITYVIWGMLAATIALPLTYFFFSSTDEKNSTAQKERFAAATSNHGTRSIFGDVTFLDFLKLATAAPCMAVMTVALLVNMVPILTSLDIKPQIAAAVAGFAGITQIAGRLISGYLLDRFNARVVGAVTVILPAVSCLLLLAFKGWLPLAVIATLIFGLAVGAEVDVIGYLAGRLFGRQNFGTLFGIVNGLMMLGTGAGPVLASLVYDWSNSYVLVFWIVVPLSLISSLLLITLGAYPAFKMQEAEKGALQFP